jgi:hypothetical protein
MDAVHDFYHGVYGYQLSQQDAAAIVGFYDKLDAARRMNYQWHDIPAVLKLARKGKVEGCDKMPWQRAKTIATKSGADDPDALAAHIQQKAKGESKVTEGVSVEKYGSEKMRYWVVKVDGKPVGRVEKIKGTKSEIHPYKVFRYKNFPEADMIGVVYNPPGKAGREVALKAAETGTVPPGSEKLPSDQMSDLAKKWQEESKEEPKTVEYPPPLRDIDKKGELAAAPRVRRADYEPLRAKSQQEAEDTSDFEIKGGDVYKGQWSVVAHRLKNGEWMVTDYSAMAMGMAEPMGRFKTKPEAVAFAKKVAAANHGYKG